MNSVDIVSGRIERGGSSGGMRLFEAEKVVVLS